MFIEAKNDDDSKHFNVLIFVNNKKNFATTQQFKIVTQNFFRYLLLYLNYLLIRTFTLERNDEGSKYFNALIFMNNE